MLVIQPEQMKAFEKDALSRFEDEMVAHSKEFAPPICEVIGDQQLRLAVRSAIRRAEGYGFTNRGPARLFIEMMFLCGSGFDNDPQYHGLGEVLRSSGDQMLRAQQIHEGYLNYLETVSGPGAENVHKALRDLAAFARQPLPFSSSDFVPGMLRAMHQVFPQKAAYVGEVRLTDLVHQGMMQAKGFGFSTVRQVSLIVILLFAFGHGCTNDPLYPWISRTLQDSRIVDPEARATRLERKALTWLDHVNARNEKRLGA